MKRVIIAAEEKPSASQYTGYKRSIESLIKAAEKQVGEGEFDKALFKLDRAADHLEILNKKIKSSGNEDFHNIYTRYKKEIKHLEDSILREL